MNRRGSFLRWYRVFPLTVVLIFGLVSFAFAFAPSLLFKSMYPLRYEDEITASAATHGVDPYRAHFRACLVCLCFRPFVAF